LTTNEQKNKEQKELKFLKSIHSLQTGGVIQSILRETRTLREEQERLMKSLQERKNKAAEQVAAPVSSKIEIVANNSLPEVKDQKTVEVKTVVPKVPDDVHIFKEQFSEKSSKPVARPVSRTDAPKSNTFSDNNRSFQPRPNFTPNRSFDDKTGTRPNGFRPNSNNNGFRPNTNSNGFRPNTNTNGFRPNTNQVGTTTSGTPTGTATYRNPNYQGSRPNPNYVPRSNNFGPRPPFNNNYSRPPYSGTSTNLNGQQRGPRNYNNSFVASKGNSFKSFAPTEKAEVLAAPERTVGNKNKNPSRIFEDKKLTNKKALIRKGYVVDERFDLDEERMGSRKLLKSKKNREIETFVAPAVEKAIITTEVISVKELSEKIGKPVAEIIKKLMILGVMATINSNVDFGTAELVSTELGITLEQKLEQSFEEKLIDVTKNTEEEEQGLISRPPVVTVMGHVDHGKTSLLDAIRKTNVVTGEAGGITQHIGAYSITYNSKMITFIDTPGHAAFSAMRARGAKITDVAILVVAADDGVMPQTKEAINIIKAANVPMIVALNKIDKPDANPERIKQQLAENGVMPEEWGGDTVIVPISAKAGVGIDKLLEMVILVAEIQNPTASVNRLAVGSVIEAQLDKNRGPVATILVQNGTLKIGDTLVCGLTIGKVKAMFNDKGSSVKSAGPSMPVSILGLADVPNAGDQVFAVDEKLSKAVIDERKSKIKVEKSKTTSGVSIDDFMAKVNEGKLKNLNIIIKADVQGSVEVLVQSLTAIHNDEVRVNCIHSGAGQVTESDVLLAQASSAKIIAFNIKTPSKIHTLAENLGVEIKDYNVIYVAVDDITEAIKGMLTIKYEDVTIGHAEIKAVFKLSSSGTIAGSYVKDGVIKRHARARIIRDGNVVTDSEIDTLKILKDDKAEVATGFECGIKLSSFSDYKVGDIIEAYSKVPIKNK